MTRKSILLVIHIIFTLAVISLFAYLTFTFKPTPLSDFQDFYWSSFSNLSEYVKGGILFILYLPFKEIGLEPYWCAFLVNSLCFISLSYALYVNNDSKWQILATCLLPLFGIWFAGYSSSVNSDIPTIILYVLGLKFFLLSIEKNKNILYILSIIVIAISLTMRSQLLYISIILIIGIIIYILFTHKNNPLIKKIVIGITLSTAIAFSICTILESNSQNKDSLSTHKRLAFYTGLIETYEAGPYCGEWTAEAVEREKRESSLPLSKALLDGLRDLPKRKLLTTILCKWDNYLFNHNQNGFWWLQYQSTNSNENTYFFLSADIIEGMAVKTIKTISALLVFLFIYEWKKKSSQERYVFIYGMTVLILFFFIHTLLEIQPRYMISPITFITLLILYLQTGRLRKRLQ